MASNKDIVIKNKFTYKRSDAGRGKRAGSKGSRPGAFVMSYMSRDENEATEALAPFSRDDNKTRYAAKQDIVTYLRRTETTHDLERLKQGLKETDGLGGRAFGLNGVSLSDKQLRIDSTAIQKAFDNGHSVQLMVLSFAHSYLEESGVLDEDFVYSGYGQYGNFYDQMKMRLAVSAGVTKMTEAGGYVNPLWVATLQSDTEHLHCHLALVDQDFSPQRLKRSGHDRGIVTEEEMTVLREGVSNQLLLTEGLAFHRKNKEKEKNSVKTYVKDLDFHEGVYLKDVQLIMTQLPKDVNKWLFENEEEEMTRANELSERLYDDVSENYDVHRDKPEAINSLYSLLKDMRDMDSTLQLGVESASDAALRSQVELISNFDEFDPVLYEYNKRLFTERFDRYGNRAINDYDNYRSFETARAHSAVSEQALVLSDFYRSELEYDLTVFSKYRSLIDINDLYFNKEADALEKEYSHYQNVQSYLRDSDSFVDTPLNRTRLATLYDISEEEVTWANLERVEQEARSNTLSVNLRLHYMDASFKKTLAGKEEIENFLKDPMEEVTPDRIAGLRTNKSAKFDKSTILYNARDLADDIEFSSVELSDFSDESIAKAQSVSASRVDYAVPGYRYLLNTGQRDEAEEWSYVFRELDSNMGSLRGMQEASARRKEIEALAPEVPEETVSVDERLENLKRDAKVITLDRKVDVLKTLNDGLDF